MPAELQRCCGSPVGAGRRRAGDLDTLAPDHARDDAVVLTVLIGPPAVGKSAVGAALAARTGRRFVDADEAGAPWYAGVGWSADRLRTRAGEVGFERAHHEWEVALTAAVVGLVDEHRDAVLALGAGHSHVSDPVLFARVVAALERAERVVLLRSHADPARSLAVLRERCTAEKGHGWVLDGVDWLHRWLTDGLDERLATHTVITAGQSPAETTAAVRALGG